MKAINPNESSLERALQLLVTLACDGEARSLAAHAESLRIPLSTAYRMVGEFSKHGLVAPGRRGHFGPGLTLAGIVGGIDQRSVLSSAARPPLQRLARTMRATAHLGLLEGDMVTYIVKEQGGSGRLFTQEGGQLEAYCSAIGKILLAASDNQSLDSYLASGPFVALTSHTVTDPEAIRNEVMVVSRQGYAVDACEVADDLACIAVPVCDRNDRVIAAISLSMKTPKIPVEESLTQLRDCASLIEKRLGRSATVTSGTQVSRLTV